MKDFIRITRDQRACIVSINCQSATQRLGKNRHAETCTDAFSFISKLLYVYICLNIDDGYATGEIRFGRSLVMTVLQRYIVVYSAKFDVCLDS